MQLPDPETCRALARAVVDAGRWRWLRGMMSTCGPVVSSVCGAACRANGDRLVPLPPSALPDFTDPLTAAGALLVAREAWGRPDLWIRASRRGESWAPDCVGTPDALLSISAPNELEALIAAILAAPVKP